MSRGALHVLWAAVLVTGGCGTETVERPLPQGLEPEVVERIRDARERVRADGDRARALGDLARVYHANKLFDLAAEAYRDASAADPADSTWPYLRGVLLLERGRPDEAAADLFRAAELDDSYAPTWLHLGEARLDAGDPSGADAAFATAIRLDDAAPFGWLGRARAARANERTELALSHVDEALRRAPDWPDARHLRSQVLAELGRDREASEAVAAFRGSTGRPRPVDPRRDGLDAFVAGRQATLARAAGALAADDLETAERLYVAALASRPDDPVAIVNLGSVYFRQNRLDAAERLLRRAVSLAPDDPQARYALARCLLATGRRGEALGHLERTTALDPGHAEAAALLDRLR